MKNKFEALKAFMSWPREWQELCAEFWAESDQPDQQRFTAADLAIAPVRYPTEQSEMMLKGTPSIGDKFPYDRTRAASMQGCRPIYRGDFGIAEREYLAKCHHETRTRREAANMFLDRYPGRSVQAVEIKIRKMLDANGVMHVGY